MNTIIHSRRRSNLAFPSFTEVGPDYEYARRMALRALISTDTFIYAFKDTLRSINQDGEIALHDEDLMTWLQVPNIEKLNGQLTSDKLLKLVGKVYAAAEKHQTPSSLRQNIDWLSELTKLSAVEADLLEVVIAAHRSENLEDVLSRCSNESLESDAKLLARLIAADEKEVIQALSKKGNLHRYNLVRYDHGYSDFNQRLETDAALKSKLLTPYENKESMIESFLNPAEPVELSAEDMPHLLEHLTTLKPVLSNAIAQEIKGINVLLYGEPGTGKTQFASLVAKLCGLNAYRIIKPDDDDIQMGHDRLAYFNIIQQMLKGRKDVVLIFDEFEDIVPDDGFAEMFSFFGSPRRRSSPMKSWMTNILESNSVPTIWISNEIKHIDRALLRRFVYPLEFRTPPQSVRHKILTKAVKGLSVDPRWIERKAHINNLPPALVRNAALVANLADVKDSKVNEVLLDRMLTSSLLVQGQRPMTSGLTPKTRYNPTFLNTTQAPDILARILQKNGQGRLCFHGVPGTGKSAFANHLAQLLDRPLMIRRASDLLSKWVGEAEQNIARTFKEARDENAVLLIDEADSFLMNREKSEHSWEVSQVNEMLQQIEYFDGILICTTNRLEQMDPAVLRRFQYKVGFHALKSEQRIDMFFHEFGDVFSQSEHADTVKAALAPLSNLTPGDFAVVRELFNACDGEMSITELLRQLGEECRIKPDWKKMEVVTGNTLQ